MSKEKIVILSYGKGGHQEQMRRLIAKLDILIPDGTKFIALTDSNKPIIDNNIITSYSYSEARDKHSLLKTLLTLPFLFVTQIRDLFLLYKNYDVVGFITTGPGVSLLPAIVCKLMGNKIIAFESWSRFHTRSYTGKLLYKLADVFFIQNKSLQPLYPKATYKGRL